MNQKTISSLDGLRGLAFFLVFFSHAGNHKMFFNIKNAGQLGVMLFFSLSGFLMAYLYGHKEVSKNLLLRYSIKRFFRVYPLFLFVITASYLLRANGYKYLYPINLQDLFTHILLMGKISVLWTIPVEMKFYLYFIALLIILSFLKTKKWKIIGLFLLYGFAFIFDTSGNLLSTWRYIEFFLSGVIAGYLYPLLPEIPTKYKKLINIIFAITLVGVIISIPRFFESIFGFRHHLWKDGFAFSLLMGACVLFCALSSGIIRWIFSNKVARYLGQISFSLYLLHSPIISIVKTLDYHPAAQLILAIIASIFVSSITYFVVENPARNFGKKLASNFNPQENHKLVAA